MWSSSETRIVFEQRPGGVVAGGDAGRDAVVEALDRRVLELEIDCELLGHGLADADRVEALHVGHALEEQDPLDDLVGVLHLVDRLVADVLGEPLVAPVAAHLGVDEVLVDRRQLGGQHVVEDVDDGGVALHPIHCRRAQPASPDDGTPLHATSVLTGGQSGDGDDRLETRCSQASIERIGGFATAAAGGGPALGLNFSTVIAPRRIALWMVRSRTTSQ